MESMDRPLEEETVSSDSCAHLNAVADDVKNGFHLIVAYYVACIAEKTPKRKANDVVCGICKLKKIKKKKRIHVCDSRICKGKKNKRIHACLECAFFGCFDLCEFGKEKGAISHMETHAVQNQHHFAININHGCVFCFQCNDYVFNETFEEILNEYQVEARRVNGSPCYLPYKPKLEEIAKFKGKIIKLSDKTFFGLRGIINIGNKCYINCVIQIFMHNPIMVDFFLTDKHECFIKGSDSCLLCEMCILFQDFHSGITLPYDPYNFFLRLGKLGASAKGSNLFKDVLTDMQQDACQIFEEFLSGLLLSIKVEHETLNCNCLIHKTFYGINRTTIKCECGAESSTFEYFNSISLSVMQGETDTANGKETVTLVDSLKKKYFEPEQLIDYTCSTCRQVNKSTSTLTIEKLPAVICFLKSWSYYKLIKTKTSSFYKKTEITSPFTFDEWVDMSDYLNSKDDDKLSDGSQHISDSLIKDRYYLFGVIVHKPASKDGGHYISYVRLKRDLWFEIDDALVYERNLQQVLEQQALDNHKPNLLFYYRHL